MTATDRGVNNCFNGAPGLIGPVPATSNCQHRIAWSVPKRSPNQPALKSPHPRLDEQRASAFEHPPFRRRATLAASYSISIATACEPSDHRTISPCVLESRCSPFDPSNNDAKSDETVANGKPRILLILKGFIDVGTCVQIMRGALGRRKWDSPASGKVARGPLSPRN